MIASSHEDGRVVVVPRWCMVATEGNPRDAMVLAQVTWWLQPAQRNGGKRSKQIVEKLGSVWLYLTDEELGAEIGMSEKQVRSARTALVKRGLLESRSSQVRGRKVTLLRPGDGLVDDEEEDVRSDQMGGSDPTKRALQSDQMGGSDPTKRADPHITRSAIEAKDSSSDASGADGKYGERGADIERLCALFADLVEQNGSKRPNITKTWRDACDQMLRLDGRDAEKIEKAIRWSQGNSFWRGNVRSMPKLREKYDQLRLAAIHEAEKAAPAAKPLPRHKTSTHVEL